MTATVTCLIAEWVAENPGADVRLPGVRGHPRDRHPDRLPRVLADCEAKRRIVEELQTFSLVAAKREDQPLPQALTAAGIVTGLERAVRLLALPYADHPDFREEWRP